MAAIVMALEAARNRDFGVTLHTEYLGDPVTLSGARVAMEVRRYGGAAGPPDAQDANVSFIDEPLLDGNGEQRVEIDQEDGLAKPLRRLVLSPTVSKTELAAMPGRNQPEAGDPQRYSYEVMFIYADGMRDALWAGDFNVNPGVVA